MNIAQRGILLLAIPLSVELGFLFVVAHLVQQADAERERAVHARLVLQTSNSLIDHLSRAGVSLFGYELTNSSLYGETFDNEINEVPKALAALDKLIGGETQKSDMLRRITLLANRTVEILSAVKRRTDQGNWFVALLSHNQIRRRTEDLIDQLIKEIHSLSEEERQIEAKSPLTEHTLRMLMQNCILAAGIFNVLLALLLAVAFTRQIGQRLQNLARNTMRLAAGIPLPEPSSDHDEIAQLDRAFHAMAASVNEASRRERAIVDNAFAIICTIDRKQKITNISEALKPILGRDPAQVIGGRFIDLVDDSDRAKTEDQLNKAFDEKTATAFENQLVHQDGSRRYILWSIQWSQPEESLFCVGSDISEQKKIEKLRRAFVAMISHDLRSPLTAIKLSLSMLVDGTYGELPSKAKTAVSEAADSSAALVTLLGQLLDLEKVENEGFTLNLARTSSADILKASISQVAAFSRASDITVRMFGAEATLLVEKERITQVVNNLLFNAIRYSKKGSNVDLSTSLEGEWLKISVIDSGPGVPDNERELIFQPFYQGNDPDYSRGGTGLGLAIAKSIVSAHKGVIGVTCLGEKGSTFWFTVPIANHLP